MNNRIIKFRAWDKREKKMRYDFAIDSSGRVLETGHSCDYQCDGVEDVTDDWIAGKGDNETVWNIMQYTGLEDSKGTPIFEGDILLNTTHREQKVEVYWRGCVKEDDSINGKEWIDWGGWKFRKLATEKEMTYAIDNDCIEVIGNIYEGIHSGEKTDILETCQKELKDLKRDTQSAKKQDEKSD